MKHIYSFFIILFTYYLSTAQVTINNNEKSVTAIRLTTPLTIDGKLIEELYSTPGYNKFTQRDPEEGTEPTQRTEFWIAYDDNALYIGSRLYDTAPDSIVKLLSRRDNFTKSDWFTFAIDSYYDKHNAFFFCVNPAGAIVDGTFFNDSWDDDSWDGVWDRAVSIDSNGWCVEMRIPYSQLRFNKKDEYIWGINAGRVIARNNEEDFFVMVPRKESGFVSHFAPLIGIKNISPPARLEILPYFVSGGEFSKKYEPADPFNDGSKFLKNFGGDIKFGLSSNLTLDVAINPDFGQVEVDPAEINLTQFETYYEEKRPFFIEGANIFSFGRGGANNNMNFNWMNPQFFYSRRIGAPPHYNVSSAYNDAPKRTTILGAAKVSGKLNSEQSIGVLAVVTEREWANIQYDGVKSKINLEPLTFYGVARTQYELKDGFQGIGYIITSVERDLRDPNLSKIMNHRAYATGIDGWTFLDRERTWIITNWTGLSYVSGTKEQILRLQLSPQRYFQRPDAFHVSIDTNVSSLSGIGSRFALNKQKGNWLFNAAFGLLSPSFETNDLGFQFRADLINAHLFTGYQWYEADIYFKRKALYTAAARSYDFGGNKTMELFYLGSNGLLKNYWNLNLNFFISLRSIDNYKTRGGPKTINPISYNCNFSINTDSRKELSGSLFFSCGGNEVNGKEYNFGSGVTLKPTSFLSIYFSPNYNYNLNVAQFLKSFYDEAATHTYKRRYIFGQLNQKTISANIRLDLTFTPTLSLQLYAQPYISVGKYNHIKELRRPNSYDFNVYGESGGSTIDKFPDGSFIIDPDGINQASSFCLNNPDFNYKSLRSNLVLRWEYITGSTLFLVWTQSRENFDHPGIFNPLKNFNNLLSSDSDNIFLLKFTYWFNL